MTAKMSAAHKLIIGVLWMGFVGACTRQADPPLVSELRNSAPGAEGRTVIWIEPIKAKKGELSPADRKLIEEINELDLNTETDRAQIIAYLADKRWFVRREAAVALGESGDAEQLLPLLPTAVDPHWVVAQEAKGQLSSKSALIRSKVFEQGLKDERAIMRTSTVRNWSLLTEVKRLHGISDPILITEILKSPCRLFSGELIEHFASVNDPGVNALLERCAIVGKNLKNANPVAITRATESASPRIIHAAALALLDCGALIGSEHVDPLLTQLERASRSSEGEIEISIAAARAVIGQPAALGLLANRLKAETLPNNLLALDYLTRLTKRISRVRHPDLAEGLAVSLEDDDSAVRRRAAEIAGASGDARMVQPLTRGLQDDDSKVRARCAYALGQLNAASAVHALVERGLEDLSTQVNDASYAALHHIAHGIPLPPYALVAEWLNGDGSQRKENFWGRDHQRWRRWYQLER